MRIWYDISCDRYTENGVPSLWFVPKGNTAVEEYEEARTVDDIVKFINKKCGTNRDSDGQLTSQVHTHSLSLYLVYFQLRTNPSTKYFILVYHLRT